MAISVGDIGVNVSYVVRLDIGYNGMAISKRGSASVFAEMGKLLAYLLTSKENDILLSKIIELFEVFCFFFVFLFLLPFCLFYGAFVFMVRLFMSF